jgi:glutamate-ammonia-ligase adenylyltransferase
VDPQRHTKLGPGGLADVEWTVQLLQLRHAADLPALRTTRTLDAVQASAAHGLLDAVQARVLGYPPGAAGTLVDDYRRATRRARTVVEQVFYR